MAPVLLAPKALGSHRRPGSCAPCVGSKAAGWRPAPRRLHRPGRVWGEGPPAAATGRELVCADRSPSVSELGRPDRPEFSPEELRARADAEPHIHLILPRPHHSLAIVAMSGGDEPGDLLTDPAARTGSLSVAVPPADLWRGSGKADPILPVTSPADSRRARDRQPKRVPTADPVWRARLTAT